MTDANQATQVDQFERFFRAYQNWCTWLESLDLAHSSESHVHDADEDDDEDEALVPGDDIIREELAELEEECGEVLPSSFKDWFSRYYTYNMDCGIVRLPDCRMFDPTRSLRPFLIADDFWLGPAVLKARERNVIMFGHDGILDGRTLCFDKNQPCSDGEWPIILWDAYKTGTPEEFSPVIFSSFTKLIECITYTLELSAEEQMDYYMFFKIDPTGAGGPGRDFWMDVDASRKKIRSSQTQHPVETERNS